MTPEARISAAAELLDLILAGQAAEKVLTGWARRSRFAGSKDRAAIRDHVFDALRCRRSFAARGGALSGRGLVIGMLRSQGIDPDTVFTGHGHAPGPLTEEERTLGQSPQGDDSLDLPGWIIPELRASLGSQLEDVACWLQRRAPVMLRTNLRKTTPAEAVQSLAADGIIAQPAGISPTSLIVTEGERRINASRAYLEGAVELQDGASQAVVDRLPIPDRGRVLDFCAGGGGKSLAMAGRSTARFYAHDANPRRMKDLPDRALRAGVHIDLLNTQDVWDQAPFDLVLCDVPCSGSGAWRRSPEGKWTLKPVELHNIQQVQQEILEQTRDLVAQDGVLAYATCSILEGENEAQVQAFLERNPDWSLLWQDHWLPGPEGDGFFAACLTRTS